MSMLDDLQKQRANIVEGDFLARIKQQQKQKTFRDNADPNKRQLSRQTSSMILLAIVVIIIVGIVVALQFLH